MSGRNWLHNAGVRGFLTAFLALASASHAQDNSNQLTGATQAQEAKPSANQPPSVTVVGPVNLEREKTVELDWAKTDCDKPQNHDEADLCEQRKMAVAAKKTVELNYIQIAVGIAGFLALLWSLRLNRKATNAAIIAAAAADRAVNDASKIAERQLRAYVSNTLGELRNLTIGHDVQAHVIMRNDGQTPAYEFVAWIGAGIGPFDPELPVPKRPPDKKPPSKSILPPGGEKHLTAFIGKLTSEQASLLESGKFVIHVVGGATYRDAFDRERETTFNLSFGGHNWLNQAGALTNAHHGNTAT